jgi:hypothetical protein
MLVVASAHPTTVIKIKLWGGMGKYPCPCLHRQTTGKRVRLPMPPTVRGLLQYYA